MSWTTICGFYVSREYNYIMTAYFVVDTYMAIILIGMDHVSNKVHSDHSLPTMQNQEHFYILLTNVIETIQAPPAHSDSGDPGDGTTFDHPVDHHTV